MDHLVIHSTWSKNESFFFGWFQGGGGFPVKCLQGFMENFDCVIIDRAVSAVQYKPLFWSVQGPTPGESVWPVPQTQETKALSAPGECNNSCCFCSFHLNFELSCADHNIVMVLIVHNKESHCRCMYVATYSQVMSCPPWRDGPQLCICQQVGLLCHSLYTPPHPPTHTRPPPDPPGHVQLSFSLSSNCARTFLAIYLVPHTADSGTADSKTILYSASVIGLVCACES